MPALHRTTLAAIAAIAAIALAGCSSGTGAPEAAATSGAASAPAAFGTADFDPPTLIEAEGFKLVPLGPDLTQVDYAAYMSSIAHLQETFTRSKSWPHEGLTMDDAVKDMETEAARFAARTSFAYAVLTPDGTRERGCVYIYPGVGEYDAVVRLWVTKAEFDAGFDEELYDWTKSWVARDWPFADVAWPGRTISWEEWDALTAKAEAQPDQSSS